MFFVKALVYLTTWLTLVFAQSAQLLAPPAGTTLKAGSNFTVQVEMGVRSSLTVLYALAYLL